MRRGRYHLCRAAAAWGRARTPRHYDGQVRGGRRRGCHAALGQLYVSPLCRRPPSAAAGRPRWALGRYR
eukprot:3049526-Alexandrium_andersonii.AAC.1